MMGGGLSLATAASSSSPLNMTASSGFGTGTESGDDGAEKKTGADGVELPANVWVEDNEEPWVMPDCSQHGDRELLRNFSVENRPFKFDSARFSLNNIQSN